ncbi:MAG: LLM class flavin-dependent oxidoreductase [Nitrososphaerota archaeon]|nr:LLM class flavin-dependent oxidoreductase [Nitrososphaerota archaeon]
MDFGFSLYPDTTHGFVKSVVRAESLGAASCFIDDSGMKFDPFVMLTTAALETSRIQLGTCTTNPISRHLGVTARAIATLNEVSNGRALLGIARGEGSLKPLGMNPISPRRLGDATILLRRLFAGESVDSADEQFRLSQAKLTYGTQKRVPVYIAATGPTMLKIAGSVADGVIISVGSDPRSIRFAIEEVRSGAKEARRDPNSVRLFAFVFSSISESHEQAVANAKPKALWFLLHANYLCDFLKIDDSQFKTIVPESDRHHSLSDILSSRRTIADEVVSPEIVDTFTISGTKSECAEKAKRIAAEGVDRIVWSIRENWDYAAAAVANSITPV